MTSSARQLTAGEEFNLLTIQRRKRESGALGQLCSLQLEFCEAHSSGHLGKILEKET